MSEYDETLYDKETNRQLKIVGNFLDGKKIKAPKPPQRPEKSDSKMDKVDRESKAKIGNIIDSQNTSVQLED